MAEIGMIGGGWGDVFPDARKAGLSAEQYQRLDVQLAGFGDFCDVMREELRLDYAAGGRVEKAAAVLVAAVANLRKTLAAAQNSGKK